MKQYPQHPRHMAPGDPHKIVLAPNDRELAAVTRVLTRGELSGFRGRSNQSFLGGPLVRRLEEDFKKYFHVRYAVSFSSATTALQAAVGALGIGPGDQVITTPFTMAATASAILLNSAVPVFADIDPDTYCLSSRTIAPRITRQTRAIMVTNILGGSADYSPILKLAKQHHLKVIEDNAQAPGATYRGKYTGTLGDIGVFSFNVHKAMQSGEGGMLVTNDRRSAYRAQLIRNHGEVVVDGWWGNGPEWQEFIAGSNYRLTELQAAIMIEQLKRLAKVNAGRTALADYLSQKLEQFPWLRSVRVLPRSRHAYYLYPMQFRANRIRINRKRFVELAGAAGFPLREGYEKPVYLLPIYQRKRMYERSQFPFVSKEYPQRVQYHKGICPVAERMHERDLIVTRLCQAPSTKKTIDAFIRAVKDIDRTYAK